MSKIGQKNIFSLIDFVKKTYLDYLNSHAKNQFFILLNINLASFGILKLGELGKTSFTMLKLGEASFVKWKLGEIWTVEVG